MAPVSSIVWVIKWTFAGGRRACSIVTNTKLHLSEVPSTDSTPTPTPTLLAWPGLGGRRRKVESEFHWLRRKVFMVQAKLPT